MAQNQREYSTVEKLLIDHEERIQLLEERIKLLELQVKVLMEAVSPA